MKLKKLLAFGLALVMCLAMAACGTNPDEKTDAEPVSITVTENWDFSVGFYPVITPMVPCQDHLSLHHADAAEYSCNAAGGICRNEAVAFHPSVCQYA